MTICSKKADISAIVSVRPSARGQGGIYKEQLRKGLQVAKVKI